MYQQVLNGSVQGDHMGHSAAFASILQQQAHNNALYQGPVVGLQALCAACTGIYPDQPNPLQVTARIKYWLGGPDPLDYISMFWNSGCPELNVPPHWHYVSFGLSDLHGDGRVHPPPPGPLQPDQLSGLGLELSFRVLGETGQPPTWPAALLQRLATYVFKTGNRLCVGDHVSWHSALDGSDENTMATNQQPAAHEGQTKQNDMRQSTSNVGNKSRKLKIRHMLIAQDPQLGTVDTPLGSVQFVQVVGITDRELKAAQRCGGSPILEALSADARCGGTWLVTDVERSHSANLPNSTDAPSDLSGVAAVCRWEQWLPPQSVSQPAHSNHVQVTKRNSEISQNIKDQIRSVLQKGLSEITSQSQDTSQETSVKTKIENTETHEDAVVNECKMSTDSVKFSVTEEYLKDSALVAADISKLSLNNQRDVTMSTDSFEMSKIENALIEEVMKLPTDSNDLKDQLKIKSEIKIEPLLLEKSDKQSEITLNNCNDTDNSNEGQWQNTNGLMNIPVVCNCGAVDVSGSRLKGSDNMQHLSQDSQQICNACGRGDAWVHRIASLNGVHLIFDREAASLLPLALRGRVLHGRHFTWTAVNGSQAITLVPPAVSGAAVSSESPIVAATNGWLQVLIPDTFAREMAEQLEILTTNDEDSDNENSLQNRATPTQNTFIWSHRGLKISIEDDIM